MKSAPPSVSTEGKSEVKVDEVVSTWSWNGRTSPSFKMRNSLRCGDRAHLQILAEWRTVLFDFSIRKGTSGGTTTASANGGLMATVVDRHAVCCRYWVGK